MNRALFFLWFALLKRRVFQFGRSLRRPTTCIGVLAVTIMFGFMFYFRKDSVVGHLVEPRVLAGGAFLMAFISVFKGFLQRGLVFQQADIDFLFTSPFTQRQILFYRLFSQYFFALVQGLVFLALFESHFRFPIVAGLCLVLFQIVCFHLATAAALFGGSIPVETHQRLRWMMLSAFLFIVALYLRVAWELKLVPSVFSSAAAGLFFYPASTLPDIANASLLHRAALVFTGGAAMPVNHLREPALYSAAFLAGAFASLWLLLKVKGDILEPSLASTGRETEKRLRVRQGRSAELAGGLQCPSRALPRWRLFQGVGALVWKNLVVARRSKRQLLWVGGFAFIYTGFTFALLYLYHHFAQKAHIEPPQSETQGFHIGIALFLAGLTFFLQRMVPFDFRRDGHHLSQFRTLPMSAFGIVLAELSVPTAFCLLLQAPCIVALVWYASFPPLILLLLVLAFPAIGIALNSVWNLHYLLAATKRAAGEDVTAVGTLMIVALSFLVFYPAGWTIFWVGRHLHENTGIQLPLAAGLAVQYAIDALVILVLGKLFHRSEVTRDAA